MMRMSLSRRISRASWLAVSGLVVACLALGMLDALGVSFGVPSAVVWLHECCPGLGAAHGGAISPWYVAVIELAALGLVAFGAWNLLTRMARTRRFLTPLLSQEVSMPARLHTLLAELDLQDRTSLIRTSQPLACCYGYARPRVCLSAGLVQALSSRQLRAVLTHERHHMTHRHPLKTLLLDLLADTFFFLPILTELRDFCVVEMELAADRFAVHYVGRKPLAGALHRLLSGGAIWGWQDGIAVRALDVTQARIDHLLAGTGVRWRLSLPAVASTAVPLSLLCVLIMGGVG